MSKTILLGETTIKDHVDSQNTKYSEYVSNLLLLFYEYNIEFTILQLSKILVAAMLRYDLDFAKFLLTDKRYDLPTILKTCDILDSERLYKQLNKKTEKLKDKKKVAKHKSVLANLKALNEGTDGLSLTKARIKFLKNNWLKNLPKEQLEFMALLYPTKSWKRLIDLFHLKPNDFQLDWFTTYIFTKEAPENSIVAICNNINVDNCKEILNKYKLPYDFLRLKYKELLTEEILQIILDYTKIEDIIRHWSSFNSEINIIKLKERLNGGEEINMPYGELMKRIQMLDHDKTNKEDEIIQILINIAEKKLLKYKVNIEEPVVVLGDASASMDVAVKTSSIITSILCKLCNAKMHLFRDKDEIIENPPTNVKEVLEVMKKFKAYNATSPAASLFPYYERKEIVKTFIIVTDEEENTPVNGGYIHDWTKLDGEGLFTDTFKKYREEVYPAKIVFVSFLNSNKDGMMVAQLKKSIPNIEKDLTQFIMSGRNPDLRKLDEMLNTLSMKTDYYDDKCERLMNIVEKADKTTLFNKTFILDILDDNIAETPKIVIHI